MRVRLWGTRGSLASAGPETVRYGGNTACVEVVGAGGEVIILDAGSGIRRAGAATRADLQRVDILLTHLHMDHVQGLGFFGPLFRPDLEVHIWGPASTKTSLHDRLTRYLSPPLFPVRLRDIESHVALDEVPRGTPFAIGAMEVVADPIIHPGPTVGYRLSEAGTTLAYLPDHEPALGSRSFPEAPAWTSGDRLAHDADLVIHDAQYTEDEYRERVGWGHSTLEQALAFAESAGARRLVAFHHDPSHDDAMLDGMMETARPRPGLELIPGREGWTVTLGETG